MGFTSKVPKFVQQMRRSWEKLTFLVVRRAQGTFVGGYWIWGLSSSGGPPPGAGHSAPPAPQPPPGGTPTPFLGENIKHI